MDVLADGRRFFLYRAAAAKKTAAQRGRLAQPSRLAPGRRSAPRPARDGRSRGKIRSRRIAVRALIRNGSGGESDARNRPGPDRATRAGTGLLGARASAPFGRGGERDRL